MNDRHIVVVGAGPGGLTASMILARRGFRVTTFEKRNEVGGRNSPIRLGPFTFDTGPTFLMMRFILDEMFREAGRRVEDYLELVRLEPMYDLVFDDSRMQFTTDHAAMKEQIRAHFPGREEGLDAFLKKEGARFDHLYPCLQKDYGSFAAYLDPVFWRAVPYLGAGRSVYGTMHRHFKDEWLTLCFTFQSKYLGMSPWDCPAAFGMLPYIEHAYGVYHVQGGLSEISAAMARVLEEAGGELHLETPVRRLLIEHGQVRGVELEGGDKVEADEVVVNADFAQAMGGLVEPHNLRKWHPDRLVEKAFSCSTFMLYLGLDKLYDVPHHTIVFARDYRGNIEDITHRGVPSHDMSFYVRNASVTDPSLAPEGKSAVYVLVPVPNCTAALHWDEQRDAYRERVLDVIAARTPMPDIRDHIEAEHVITPEDWWLDYDVYIGATFSMAHTIGQLLYFRPHNEFEELEHCYLVGGGTHPGSGLPTIYESGRITANLISRRHGVPFEPPTPLPAPSEMPGS
jgi:phytoene desaturase